MAQLFSLLLLSGCTSNIPELYAEARTEALARPTPIAADWKPDALVILSSELVSEAVGAAIDEAATDPQTVRLTGSPIKATLTPQARLSSLEITGAGSCEDCLKIEIALDGESAWTLGPAKGSFPFELELSADVELHAEKVKGGRDLSAKVEGVDRVRVAIGRARLPELPLDEALQDWLKETLLDRTQAIPLGVFGTKGQPLRDFRIRAAQGLQLEILTEASHGAPLSSLPAAPRRGWKAAVSAQTLLSEARKAAFEQGVVYERDGLLELYADPRALTVEGNSFTLDVRLWNLHGRGWWRDYTATGSLGVRAGELSLEVSEITGGEASEGLSLDDVVSVLAEGPILDAVIAVAKATIPTRTEVQVSGQEMTVTLTRAQGRDGSLVLDGTASTNLMPPDRVRSPLKKPGSPR